LLQFQYTLLDLESGNDHGLGAHASGEVPVKDADGVRGYFVEKVQTMGDRQKCRRLEFVVARYDNVQTQLQPDDKTDNQIDMAVKFI